MQEEPCVGEELLRKDVFHKLDVEMPNYLAKLEAFP